MSLRVVGERAPDRLSRIADHIAATAEASAVGVRVCRIARDTMVAALESAVSARVRSLGFVFVRATKPPPRSRASPVLSRHVVIWCDPNKASRRTAIEWVRALSTRSPRGHLLVLAEQRAADRRRAAPRRRDHGSELDSIGVGPGGGVPRGRRRRAGCRAPGRRRRCNRLARAVASATANGEADQEQWRADHARRDGSAGLAAARAGGR